MKSYIFLKTLSSSQFQFDRALNQPWALEFQHHWGMGARVIRDTKYSVYNLYIGPKIKFISLWDEFTSLSQKYEFTK